MAATILTPITCKAEDNNYLDTKIPYESYAVDSEGNVYPVTMEISVSKPNTVSDTLSQTLTYYFDFPDNEMHSGSLLLPDDPQFSEADSHGKMIATLDIFYSKSGNSYLLTSVSGGWTIYEPVYVLTQNLAFGCTGASPSTWGQAKYYIPGSSFSYNTGFTQYVPDDGGSDVGAVLSFRLQYGETWDFVLTNKRLSSTLDIGGRW